MDTIRERISKLLRMTVENGCSEDEQETALKFAATAAAKAGIDLDEMQAAEAKAHGREYKPTIKSHANSRSLKWHQLECAHAAATLIGVKAYTINNGHGGFEFVGRDELIEAAIETMMFLMNQIEALYKQNLPKGLSKIARAQFRSTFKAACAHRTHQRANSVVRELRFGAKAPSSGNSTVLTISGHFKRLEDEIFEFEHDGMTVKEWNEKQANERQKYKEWAEANPQAAKVWEKRVRRASRYHRERSMPTGNGTQQGMYAGERVKLRKEITQ